MHGLPSFPHDSRAHKHWKFEKLRSRFGWAGEGRFWALNGIIAATDACCLDLGDVGVVAMLCHELGMEGQTDLEAFIAYLRDHCRLVRAEGQVITTGMVQDQLAKATAAAIRNRANYERRKEGMARLPLIIPRTPSPETIEEKNKNAALKAGLEADFDEWWKLYPAKQDKARARAKWLLHARNPEKKAAMLAGLKRQLAERAELAEKGSWLPTWKYPKTWLHNENWNDEPLTFTPNHGSTTPRAKQGHVSTTGSADQEV